MAVFSANVGPADPARPRQIAQFKRALAAAVQEEQTLLASAQTYVGAALTDTQKALWATIRANPPKAGGLAYAPSVTQAQRTALSLAKTKLARRRATARTCCACGYNPS